MRLPLPLVPVLLLFIPACRSNDSAPPATVDTGSALMDMGELYNYLAVQKVSPPKKAEDLAEYEGSMPAAYAKIKSGDIVVVWGTGYSSGSSQLLAYEKDCATSGGKVLLRNGSVKDMTAGEFQAAKK
jgi:hypothetical protein